MSETRALAKVLRAERFGINRNIVGTGALALVLKKHFFFHDFQLSYQ
ncbi:hypothetical protein A33Q_4371 [Indibacter alkaliphilus LW1]|uniref:Uncharacterized protein n=1 Tax=Indibacter alkaliphilus (strain CCUG 57479 / KCTC 22604 / LW1) TaxID=1189612 RepID=S2DQV1_INDAL|nr:hypothetical protein A33Q_4371 [Indibacter alkaliphilus LW1]